LIYAQQLDIFLRLTMYFSIQAHSKWQRLIQRTFPQLSRGHTAAATAANTTRATFAPSNSTAPATNTNYGAGRSNRQTQPAGRGGRGAGNRGGSIVGGGPRTSNGTSRVNPRPPNAGPPAKVPSFSTNLSASMWSAIRKIDREIFNLVH
jgi:hypothetical protein